MRCVLAILLGFVLLLVPRNARAEEFLFPLNVDSGGGFEFDGASFRMDAPFVAFFGGEEVLGVADLVSGPLLDLDVSSDGGTSVYTYGPGEVSITAAWTSQNGSFAGTIESLTISLCEGCDPLNPGVESTGDVIAILGPGLFDPAFAFLLDIPGPSTGGFFLLPFADGVTGDPSTPLRFGGSSEERAPLTVEAPVPEPSMTALAVAYVGALLVRRRRRRAS